MSQKNILFDLNGVLFSLERDEDTLLIPIDEGIELLYECHSHEKGHQLFICSNIGPRYLDYLHTKHAHIMVLFKGIITPDVVGIKKPHPDFFSYLLDRYELKPEETILLDDQDLNIKAVELLGITGIHVTNFDEVRHSLKQLDIL